MDRLARHRRSATHDWRRGSRPDAAYATSARFRALIKDDPRRFYYPFMAVLAGVIGFLIFQALPTQLVIISANMANLAAVIFPLVIMYLNSKLPKAARITWWSYLVLGLNALFFGFFFLNFVWVQAFAVPLVRFRGRCRRIDPAAVPVP